MPRDYIDGDRLEQLWGSNLTTREIATRLGYNKQSIEAYARRHNFPTRPEARAKRAERYKQGAA